MSAVARLLSAGPDVGDVADAMQAGREAADKTPHNGFWVYAAVGLLAYTWVKRR